MKEAKRRDWDATGSLMLTTGLVRPCFIARQRRKLDSVVLGWRWRPLSPKASATSRAFPFRVIRLFPSRKPFTNYTRNRSLSSALSVFGVALLWKTSRSLIVDGMYTTSTQSRLHSWIHYRFRLGVRQSSAEQGESTRLASCCSTHLTRFTPTA